MKHPGVRCFLGARDTHQIQEAGSQAVGDELEVVGLGETSVKCDCILSPEEAVGGVGCLKEVLLEILMS